MSISDEMLSAYLDGELPAEQQADIERALNTDASVKLRLEELRQSNEMLNAAYSSIDDEPMPDGILDMLAETPEQGDETASKIVAFPAQQQAANSNRWALPLAASVALAVGFAGGTMTDLLGSGEGGELQLASIQPGDPIHKLLETKTSGEIVDLQNASKAEVKLTFKSADDKICREFIVESTDKATQAVACRQSDDSWQVQLASRAEPKDETGERYATASAEDEAFGLAVDQLIEGDPLDAEVEKALIDRHWGK